MEKVEGRKEEEETSRLPSFELPSSTSYIPFPVPGTPTP